MPPTSNTPTTHTNTLVQTLRNLHTHQIQTARNSRLVLAISIILATLLLLLLADAIHPLPAQLRLTILILFTCLSAASLLLAITGLPTRKATPPNHQLLYQAQHLEQRYCIPSNILLNALTLSLQPQPFHHPLSQLLSERALRHAEQAIKTISPIIPPIQLSPRRPLFLLTAITSLFLALLLLQPYLLTATLPRLFSPLGDHPPFSRTRISLELTPAAFSPGSDAIIAALTTGPNAPSATLVELDDLDQPLARLPMHPTAPDRFERRLSRLTTSLRLRADAGPAQSKIFTLQPTTTTQNHASNPIAADNPAPNNTNATDPQLHQQNPTAQPSSNSNPSPNSASRTSSTTNSPAPNTALATGPALETRPDQPATFTDTSPASWSAQVPPQYRELVSRYFDRLNKDQSKTQ